MAFNRSFSPATTTVLRRDVDGRETRSAAAGESRRGARIRAAKLSGRADAFICSPCITLVGASADGVTIVDAQQKSKRAGVHIAVAGTEEWRLLTYGPHKVCALCTGIFKDGQTPARAFAGPAISRRAERAPERQTAGKKRWHRSGGDREPTNDVMDKPWMVTDGSFEGGKRS